MSDLERLQELFWQAFAAPNIESDKAWDAYSDVEMISDLLAGPVYNISTVGHCDYVFAPSETHIPGVTDAETFRAWCMEMITSYRQALEPFRPQDDRESKDLGVLQAQGTVMEQLANLAYSILKEQGL